VLRFCAVTVVFGTAALLASVIRPTRLPLAVACACTTGPETTIVTNIRNSNQRERIDLRNVGLQSLTRDRRERFFETWGIDPQIAGDPAMPDGFS